MARHIFSFSATIIFLAAALINHAPAARATECGEKPVLFLADVSGSMRYEAPEVQTAFGSGAEDNTKIEKIDIVRELLYRLAPALAAKQCRTGIYLIRYLPGNPDYYSVFMRTGSHGPQGIREMLMNDFITEFPVFNRRTPLADTFRYLDKNILEPVAGKMTLVLVSDGRDSFYNNEKDLARSAVANNDQVLGPVSEVRRLKNIYGDFLNIHTVYVPGQSNETEDTGRSVLAMIAAAGQGEHYPASELLEEASQLIKFTDTLCCR
ncbi:MAG: hypothetical protein R3297_04195 [Desulfobulbales bacterium]|nr:hypothetical protein [Desulfobulbales bacterium]